MSEHWKERRRALHSENPKDYLKARSLEFPRAGSMVADLVGWWVERWAKRMDSEKAMRWEIRKECSMVIGSVDRKEFPSDLKKVSN